MHASLDALPAKVAAIVVRFRRQLAQPPLADAELAGFAQRVADLVRERGLPPPLRDNDPGAPGGLPENELAEMVRRLVAAGDDSLREVAKQLVKALYYPEFTVCRDSYREQGREGRCKRQDLERARQRVSGTHCVDCPYWVAMRPLQHEALLRGAWVAGADDFEAGREIFLPEDFRALHDWRHQAARGRG